MSSVMSTVPPASTHHFHQFSGMHGVPWCWTDDLPVDLCPVAGTVETVESVGAGAFDLGARR